MTAVVRRVMLAHPKSMETDETVRYAEQVTAALEALPLKGGDSAKVEMITGRESVNLFTDKGRRPLDWRAWQNHVLGPLVRPVFGVNPGEPRFHYLVVVPAIYIGRATADLIGRALKQAWPRVYFFDAERGLRKVEGINALDTGNMKAGWALRVTL